MSLDSSGNSIIDDVLWLNGTLKKIREEADYTIRTGNSASDFLETVDQILSFAGFPSSE